MLAPDPPAPDPLAPNPLAPDPLAPVPLAPDPLAPDPLAPDPLAPDPLAPDPAAPDPLAPAGFGWRTGVIPPVMYFYVIFIQSGVLKNAEKCLLNSYPMSLEDTGQGWF